MPEGQGELGTAGGEGIGDVLDEDQAENQALVMHQLP